jgi:hypothetical protein
LDEVSAFSKRILASRQQMLQEMLLRHVIAGKTKKKRSVVVN